jgi:hypothetical protein
MGQEKTGASPTRTNAMAPQSTGLADRIAVGKFWLAGKMPQGGPGWGSSASPGGDNTLQTAAQTPPLSPQNAFNNCRAPICCR